MSHFLYQPQFTIVIIQLVILTVINYSCLTPIGLYNEKNFMYKNVVLIEL